MIASVVLFFVSLRGLGGMGRVVISLACVAAFAVSLGVWFGVFGTLALMVVVLVGFASCVCSFIVLFRYLWRLCCG